MKIDVGEYTDAVQEDEDSKIPIHGEYEFQIKEMPEEGETKDGDPKMVFKLEVVNASNPALNGRIVKYHAKMPSIFFTRIMRAAGVNWVGSQADTDQIASDMYNKTLKATVVQKSPEDYPNIKKFHY